MLSVMGDYVAALKVGGQIRLRVILQETQLLRTRDRLGAVAHPQLVIDLPIVPLHRTDGERGCLRDLAVGASGGEQAQNLPLSIRKRGFAQLSVPSTITLVIYAVHLIIAGKDQHGSNWGHRNSCLSIGDNPVSISICLGWCGPFGSA